MWYEIDAVDRLSALCPEWEREAARNGAPGLVPATVIGRPIWAFIEGEATSFHYARVFETVRQTGAPAEFRLRADSPARQSLLELRIAPLAKHALKVTTTVLRERAVVRAPLWDHQVPRSADLVLACSWCKAVKVHGAWLPVAEAAQQRNDLRAACPPEIVHHVCPGCENSLVRGRRHANA